MTPIAFNQALNMMKKVEEELKRRNEENNEKKGNKLIIACHHKSGTVLSRKIFSKYSKHLGTTFNSWGKNEKNFKKITSTGFDVLTHSSVSQ